jgi:clan AA aspartic protease
MLRGYFHNKCPRTKLTIVGTEEIEVEAIVDTGFNGYLTLPEHIAERIGLQFTNAISSATVADGSTSPSLVYSGKIIYDNSRVNVLIDVQPQCNILMGTALLEEFNLSLFVDVALERVEFNHSGRVSRPTQ